MCKTTPLQHKIQQRTGNGDLIANFLADTIEGKYPDAKYHHKLEAVKLLARYGSDQPESEESQFWGLIPTPEELSLSKREEDTKPEEPEREVTHLDILNYDIAHLIRQETAEGHTIAEFLAHVMTRRDQPFTPKKLRIKHTDRMAAAKEILRRGHGHWGRKSKLKVYADDVEDTNDYDTLHTDLAKRMREYNEHGTDAARFLLDVMNDTSLDPEEGYTWHHKMSAAHEIIRRGWDTNYDKITPEMLQTYWRNQQSTRLSIGQKKQQEDRQAEEKAPFVLSLSKDESASNRKNNESIPNRHSCESRNPAASENPLSPRERARVRGTENTSHPSTAQRADEAEHDNTSSPSCTSMSVLPDDDLDCYYEPLTPEDQAIFNYNSLIESGEFEEGEITFVPPSEAAHRDYAIALKQIKEAAASEGIPLLPNPLAGTLRHPTIRGP